MLTARVDLAARIEGLASGADDDVIQPLHPEGSVARVKALPRRGRPSLSEANAADVPAAGS